MEENLFTKESYVAFLKDRSFVTNNIYRDDNETFFDTISKTDLSKDKDGKEIVNFLRTRI